MTDILVLYQNSPAALVGPARFTYLGEVRHLPPGHPVIRVVTYKAYYAQLVRSGELAGAYSDEDADRFARLALIDLDELFHRRNEGDEDLAARFSVPTDQIARAREDLPEGPRG